MWSKNIRKLLTIVKFFRITQIITMFPSSLKYPTLRQQKSGPKKSSLPALCLAILLIVIGFSIHTEAKWVVRLPNKRANTYFQYYCGDCKYQSPWRQQECSHHCSSHKGICYTFNNSLQISYLIKLKVVSFWRKLNCFFISYKNNRINSLKYKKSFRELNFQLRPYNWNEDSSVIHFIFIKTVQFKYFKI